MRYYVQNFGTPYLLIKASNLRHWRGRLIISHNFNERLRTFVPFQAWPFQLAFSHTILQQPVVSSTTLQLLYKQNNQILPTRISFCVQLVQLCQKFWRMLLNTLGPHERSNQAFSFDQSNLCSLATTLLKQPIEPVNQMTQSVKPLQCTFILK